LSAESQNEELALARVGVRCHVVEITDAPLGASLGLSGRATDALSELGIYEATGTPFKHDNSPTAQHDAAGKLVSPAPKRPDWPGAKDAIGAYRPVFRDILTDHARRLGVIIQHGTMAETIEDSSDAVVVTFSDGRRSRYDMVVGADGIGSRTRGLVFPDAPTPAYAGHISIRWMAPGPAVPREVIPIAEHPFQAL
jgi:2-polyprenyl-6-methoxyphenol hydroxylase-like FAD-dependent oxidoreductase